MLKTLLILSLFFSFYSFSYSQQLKGKVLDAGNSEYLIGATIKVIEDKTGAVSDLDGTYSVDVTKAGVYTVEFTYVGYKTYTVKNVEIKQGQVTKLDASLNADGVATEEILVEASTSMSNENTLLNEQKNANKISDGISEQQIKRAPDAAASDVLKRVIGVTIVKDKFVYVRGTNDRYNNTTLNGVLIPSTEPDKKAFSFDIFPSNLIENIVISKSFTPDLTGNFTGGLVQITTKEFPEAFTYSFNVNSSITGQTTGKDFYSYNAGQSKLLFFNMGSDDGGRNLPSNFPQGTVSRQNFSQEQLQEFGRAFRNNWTQTSTSAPLNAGFQFSVGNNIKFLNNPLGFLAAFTYKNSFSNKTIEKNDFNTDNTTLSSYAGRSSEYSVLDGGLLNLNYKLGTNHKLSLKNTFSQSSENQTEFYNGNFYPENSERNLYSTVFTERYLYSTQLIGSHYFHDLGRMELTWKASYSESKRNQPDLKTMTYQRDIGTTDPFFAPILTNTPNTPAGGRFFSNLFDIVRGGNLDLEFPLKIGSGIESRLKLGTNINTTTRSFNARSFAPALNTGASFLLNFEGIDTIFKAENISPEGYYYSELTRESDNYSASEKLYTGYAMVEIPMGKLKIITGARFESTQQDLNTLGRIGQPVNVTNKNNDVLPSLNLSYNINDKTNLRASVTQTISRPELREIAPFSYTDFVSGITTVGNVELDRSLNQNYDLRFETYPMAGEIFAVSLFYKHMNSPIEEVFIPVSTNRIKTFQNAKDGARNYGMEVEMRKNLGFVHKLLKNVSVNANFSLIDSKVNLEGLGSTLTSTDRKLQGQSPYTINLGLYYDDYETGTGVNLLYNKFGDRISEVGLNGFNDIYEKGNDLIDLTITQKLFKKFELKLAFKDLLNKDNLFTQQVNGEEKTIKKINTGNTQSVTLSYKF